MDKNLIYLESILLVSDKPLSIKTLAKELNLETSEIKSLIKYLEEKFNNENSGIHIANSWDKIQFTTNPISEPVVKNFIKQELNSNLTDASLETLTVIAYRGPITKSELEQIRGVNCSLILRNLLIIGLIDKEYDKEKISDIYFATNDFFRYLGINKATELPDFERLSNNEILKDVLEESQEEINIKNNQKINE